MKYLTHPLAKLTLIFIVVLVSILTFAFKSNLFTKAPAATQLAAVGASDLDNAPGWTPPIGIPEPSFGIHESYRMYDDPANRNPALTYTENSEHGFYTHYVDNTNASSTDTNNLYGTAEKPRKTIPRYLSAGSVVEVHGSNYTTGPTLLDWSGNQEQPVFIRGINRPRYECTMSVYNDVGGSDAYVIVEGMSFKKFSISSPSHHIVLRNSEVSAIGGIGTGVLIAGQNNLVIYNNEIHDFGIWDPNLATGDKDYHGVNINGRVDHVWILDNLIYHAEGDAVQITGGVPSSYINHIYVGRNIAHHNKQSGLWVKYAEDVIFSQNVIYGHRKSNSASGPGIGFQAQPQRVWFLFNNIYDNDIGITADANDGPTEGHYFIGNIIHDIHYSDFDPNSPWSLGNAILMWSGGAKYIVNNTIDDVDGGISLPAYGQNGPLKIFNNIISNVTGKHVVIGHAGSASLSDISNNLFDETARIRWGSDVDYNVSSLKVATGKCAGCLETDPKFINPTSNDFRLTTNSSARDAGTTSDVYQTFSNLYNLDINYGFQSMPDPNDPKTWTFVHRPQGSAWDIGAYESTDVTPPIIPPITPPATTTPPEPPPPPAPVVHHGGGGGGGPARPKATTTLATTTNFANLTPAQRAALIRQLQTQLLALLQQLLQLTLAARH